MAQLIGKDRVTITNALRLLRLAPGIRKMLVDGKLSAGHGRALLGLEDPVRQLNIAEQAVADGLSVRAVEKLVSDGGESENRRRGCSSLRVTEVV